MRSRQQGREVGEIFLTNWKWWSGDYPVSFHTKSPWQMDVLPLQVSYSFLFDPCTFCSSFSKKDKNHEIAPKPYNQLAICVPCIWTASHASGSFTIFVSSLPSRFWMAQLLPGICWGRPAKGAGRLKNPQSYAKIKAMRSLANYINAIKAIRLAHMLQGSLNRQMKDNNISLATHQ